MPNKVKFFYNATRSLNAFESAVRSDRLPRIDVKRVTHKDIPKRANLVVTTGHLGTPVERFAARLGAMPCILPEAGEWVDEKVGSAIADNEDLVIVGYDLEPAL